MSMSKKDKERQLLITHTELNCLKDHLETLEVIERNNGIPHQIIVDNLARTFSKD
jgi:hypothetical protein